VTNEVRSWVSAWVFLVGVVPAKRRGLWGTQGRDDAARSGEPRRNPGRNAHGVFAAGGRVGPDSCPAGREDLGPTHQLPRARRRTDAGRRGGARTVAVETYRNVTPDLIERTVTVTAASDQRYYLDFGWKAPEAGEFYSFLGPEGATKR